MSEESIKIALIGCGRWGKLILRDLKSLGCHVSVVSAHLSSIENAKAGGADFIVDSLSDIPFTVNGAVVATPSSSHFKVIQEIVAKQQGIPIYTEKPMCLEVEEAAWLEKHLQGQLFVMHKWRYHQGIKELSKLAKGKTLGPVKGIKLVRIGWSVPHKDVDPVWILLPHDLSIVLDILGYIPPAKFAVMDRTSDRNHGMIGQLVDEQHWVHFEVSERSATNQRSVVVYFENGIAQLSDSYQEFIEVYERIGHASVNKPEVRKIVFENVMPLYSELKAFVTFISSGENAPKSSVGEGGAVVRTIHKLRELSNI